MTSDFQAPLEGHVPVPGRGGVLVARNNASKHLGAGSAHSEELPALLVGSMSADVDLGDATGPKCGGGPLRLDLGSQVQRVLLEQADGYPKVRLFAQPRSDARVVGAVPSGEEALCLSEFDDFLEVRWRHLEGWVGLKNVTLLLPALAAAFQSRPSSPIGRSGGGRDRLAPLRGLGGVQGPCSEGQEVQAWSQSSGSWVEATVSYVEPDGAVNVSYHDRQLQKLVPGNLVRTLIRPLA